MMNNNIYVLIYDKVSVSSEGYDSLDKAIEHITEQGYKHFYGWIYCNEEHSVYIKEIKIK